HDALPISAPRRAAHRAAPGRGRPRARGRRRAGSRSPLPSWREDAVLAPRSFRREAVRRCERTGLRDAPFRHGAGRGRALAALDELKCRREARLERIAERVLEIVVHGAAGEGLAEGIVGRREAVAVVAEALVVESLELDAEVGRAAVVGRVEAERLAAGRRADEDDLDADPAQAVDDRLARGAGVGAGEHVHGLEIE